jgi:hypothetical protein
MEPNAKMLSGFQAERLTAKGNDVVVILNHDGIAHPVTSVLWSSLHNWYEVKTTDIGTVRVQPTVSEYQFYEV